MSVGINCEARLRLLYARTKRKSKMAASKVEKERVAGEIISCFEAVYRFFYTAKETLDPILGVRC